MKKMTVNQSPTNSHSTFHPPKSCGETLPNPLDGEVVFKVLVFGSWIFRELVMPQPAC